MKNSIDEIGFSKLIIVPLIIIASLILFGNLINQEVVAVIADTGYIISTIIVVIISITIAIKFGITGSLGKAWIFFALFAGSVFSAEITWIVFERVLDIDPYPSLADVFYIISYPFLFLFSMSYIKPIHKKISKNMILASIGISLLIVVPVTYLTITSEVENETEGIELGLATLYPILDGIVLVPAVLGIALFFRGQVNFMWTLILLGTLSLVTADYWYWFAVTDDSYYSGHLLDIFFIWAYVLYSIGIYHQFRLFNEKNTNVEK